MGGRTVACGFRAGIRPWDGEAGTFAVSETGPGYVVIDDDVGNVARALGGRLIHGGDSVVFGVRDDVTSKEGVVPFMRAAQAEVIILAVPFSATREVLSTLASHLHGKIVVDATNPVNPDWSPMLLGQEDSGGEQIARALPGARIVKAFNTIFADVMRAPELVGAGKRVTCFIAADDPGARAIVSDLATSAGFAPLEVGPLAVARHLESMAHLNIQIAVGMGGGTGAAFEYHRFG